MAEFDPDLEMDVDRVVVSPGRARSAVRELLGDAAETAFGRDALLATSELVTATLMQGDGSCRLLAWYAAPTGWIRVEVIERSPAMPGGDDPGHTELGDDRLTVLLSAVTAYGIEQSPSGRTMWFELEARPGEHAAASPTSTFPSDFAPPGPLER